MRPEDVVLIAGRDYDPEEKVALRESGIQIYSMRTIDEIGMAAVTHKALEQLAHLSRIHLSIDMDFLDPQIAPGVGTPVQGGLTLREARLFLEILADSQKVGSVDITEINPILDISNQTGQIAVNLLATLLGQVII
jgi:arginase